MISREYLVLMPSDPEGFPTFDIPVQGNASWGAVGLTSGPVVVVGVDGFYVEQRNRTIRVPVLAGTATAAAAGFVPRFRLGFEISIVPVNGIGGNAHAPMSTPRVQCSRSLVGDVFSTAAGATTPGDDTFQDPSGTIPTIRLHNTADSDIAGRLFRLFLSVMEAKDEDRDPTGT